MSPSYPFGFVPFEDYSTAFENIAMERADGVITVRLHTGGGELTWSTAAHREISHVWNLIGLDPENKVVVLTGTGSSFLDRSSYDPAEFEHADPMWWTLMAQDARKLLHDLLEIEQPMIAALNGPVAIHSQIPLLCDIILATPETTISDSASHFPGVVPGDGHHVIWPIVMGMNRARHLLLTRQGLSARDACDAGVIAEVVPASELLDRAHALARQLLEMSPLALRQFRQLAVAPLKRALTDALPHGLGVEGYSIIRELPGGGFTRDSSGENS